ncbi:MAG: rod shape-determining protein RodA [Verrucomicrobia bacterium]|nr:rod shape-determining protein RodA [Verrucomicrobiota bacterium]
MNLPELNLNPKRPRLDWQLAVALLGLMLIGLAFIFSAKSGSEGVAWHNQFYARQFIWYAAGTVAAIVVCLIDYRYLSRYAVLAYWLAIALLIGVLFFGSSAGGAKRWIDLGFFKLQPSEFAKLAFIFIMGHFLSRPAGELRAPLIFLKGIGLTLLPFVLILKEPDLGSALVLIPIALVMMFVAGIPARYIIRLLGAAALLIALLVVDVLFAPDHWRIPLEDYQRHRLLVYFGRDFAPQNASPEQRRRAQALQRERSYQIEQALISVGSGGLTGKGWRQGQQIALGYLPPGASHNDFIFSVIAEEKGFLGSLVVLSLYAVVLLSGVRIANQARDPLGRLLAMGVVALLFSHVFVNIGMNIRLMPVTGIPLPLLSYGGSSVVCSLIAAGILQNIHLHHRT